MPSHHTTPPASHALPPPPKPDPLRTQITSSPDALALTFRPTPTLNLIALALCSLLAIVVFCILAYPELHGRPAATDLFAILPFALGEIAFLLYTADQARATETITLSPLGLTRTGRGLFPRRSFFIPLPDLTEFFPDDRLDTRGLIRHAIRAVTPKKSPLFFRGLPRDERQYLVHFLNNALSNCRHP